MLVSGFFDGAYIGQDENGAIYDRNYQAEFFARYFSSFVSNGVFNKNVDSFKVVPLDGRNVVVKSGSCFINGYFGFEKEHNELILEENINSNSRIDRIILRLDLSSRDITIQVLKGEEAEEPTPKELNRSGDIYEIALADITISSNLENITNKNIKDLRKNNDLCGYVNHTLDEVDQNIFYNQIFKYLRKSRIKEKDEFKKWFEDIKSILNTNTVSKHIVKSVFSESGVHNFRYNINTNKFEKFNNDTQEFEKVKLGADTTLKKTPKIILKSYMKRITISWKDSEDVTVKREIVRRWKGTILVKKIGSPPLSYDDGEILVNNTERNKYLNDPFIDENIESNTEYYYGVFPYDDEGNYNVNIENIVHGHENLLEEMFFSFIVDLNEIDSLNNITYADDSTDYTTPESWDNSPLFQSIKPCLLKDGKVQYYLDPNNYDLKLNGEPSNLNGDDGDVMVEFPPLIYKMEILENKKIKFYLTVYSEDLKNKDEWEKIHLDYNFNNISNNIYISAYLCSIENDYIFSKNTNDIVNNLKKETLQQICNKLLNKNNNSFIIHHVIVQLLFLLGFLRFKTTNLQKIFNLKSGNTYKVGSLKTGGLFSGCGSSTQQEAVKFCGIELTINNEIVLGGVEQYYLRSVSPIGNYTQVSHSYQLYTTYNKFFIDNINSYLQHLYSNNKKYINYLFLGGGATRQPPSTNNYTSFSTIYSKTPNTFEYIKNTGFLLKYDETLKIESTNKTYLTLNNNICPAGGSHIPSFAQEFYKCTFKLNDINNFATILNGYNSHSNPFLFYYMYLPPNEE